jgi:hypothetical protein
MEEGAFFGEILENAEVKLPPKTAFQVFGGGWRG